MSILYKPELLVECDGDCGTVLTAAELEVADFYQLKQAIDADGWKTERIDRQWCHFCPDCAEDA